MIVTSCFVYKVFRDLESIDHLRKWSVQVNVLLNNCKQNITSLSLLVGTTVVGTLGLPVFTMYGVRHHVLLFSSKLIYLLDLSIE